MHPTNLVSLHITSSSLLNTCNTSLLLCVDYGSLPALFHGSPVFLSHAYCSVWHQKQRMCDSACLVPDLNGRCPLKLNSSLHLCRCPSSD